MEFEEIYKNYLKKFNIVGEPTIFREFEEVFLIARKEFYDYKISLDQFSSICETLHIAARKNINILTEHLGTALDAGMELSWNVRQRHDEDYRQFNYSLQYIHDYKKES